ncbi:hypothetical protein OWV82_025425 [Melia azedarach]|uniref:Uncharacterized protein n=1 Tax=Melia azedarach TaxID=155640 RepID=A0ACC1WWK8_MELAZ|nr:hypothetical protein OWV82_025425 [Melia azedarach]
MHCFCNLPNHCTLDKGWSPLANLRKLPPPLLGFLLLLLNCLLTFAGSYSTSFQIESAYVCDKRKKKIKYIYIYIYISSFQLNLCKLRNYVQDFAKFQQRKPSYPSYFDLFKQVSPIF